MKRTLASLLVAALAALAAAVPALAQQSTDESEAGRAAERGTPVELRFVLDKPAPRGADLTIFYDTPRRAQASYIDCQLGADGFPDPDGRCGPGRYTEEVKVREGQRIEFEFTIQDPLGGGERVVKEGSRVVGDEPLVIRAFYPKRG